MCTVGDCPVGNATVKLIHVIIMISDWIFVIDADFASGIQGLLSSPYGFSHSASLKTT
jgi:hypothetical protein